MQHARGQKLQSFRRKQPFYMDLYSMSQLAQQSTAPGLQTNYKIQSGIMEILKESIPGFFNN
jgi:hypothetical protein